MTVAITDFAQFSSLRAAAERNDPEALREVAGQFEALFVQMMLKSMRDASFGDPIFGDSNAHEIYEGMLDQQLALEMAAGKGIGLADMLVRQLGGDSDPIPVQAPQQWSVSGSIARDAWPHAETAAGKSIGLAEMLVRQLDGDSDPIPVQAKQQWSDPGSFARDVWPHAERAAKKLNVAPEAILAQAALETGWGAHVPQRSDGSSSFNIFGIKAGRGWSGDSVTKATLEFEAGVAKRQHARFRAYDDVAANVDDYSNLLLRNPRYKSVSGHGDDVDGFARALQDSGYATDPSYFEKLKSVIQSKTMRKVLADLKTMVLPPTTVGNVAILP